MPNPHPRSVPLTTAIALSLAALAVIAPQAPGAELLVGTAHTSITPKEPVALAGQHRVRIARTVDNPCTATVLALEARDGEKPIDQVVLVSCDLVAIREGIMDRVRERIKPRLEDFDASKLILAATHTHTAPVTMETLYDLPKEGVMQPKDYVDFLAERLGDAVVEAWEGRQPGGVSWTLGHAVVGQNRRAVYADGHAQMYGSTSSPSFRGLEGDEDHSVDMLFLWNRRKKLRALAIAVPCPAQEVEGRSSLHADFWHDVRVGLHERFGGDLCVLGLCAPAGDQSPHLMLNKGAEARMRKARGLSETQEIARRIIRAVDDTLSIAEGDIRFDVPLVHRVETLQLPWRNITEEELAPIRARHEELSAKKDPSSRDLIRMKLDERVLGRLEKMKSEPGYTMELHALRLGDVAIATNPFELYVNFGQQIEARSPAQQTVLIQLACGSGVYVPTASALRAGGYSTKPQEVIVGPEGGQKLVERTVQVLGEIWKTAP